MSPTDIIEEGGFLSVFLLIALAPVPSELVLPMAGYLARDGRADLATVVLAGTAAHQVSAVFWYLVGRLVGIERLRPLSARYGTWIGIAPGDLDWAAARFRRHGVLAVLVGRVLPGVRAVICVPAGMARLPFWRFFLASCLGSLAWCALLTGAGMHLASRYVRLQLWLDPIAWTVAGGGLLAVIVRAVVVRRRGRGRADPHASGAQGR